MRWIISFGDMVDAYVASILEEWNEMRKAKVYLYGISFHQS
jgi:hypothetical protein